MASCQPMLVITGGGGLAHNHQVITVLMSGLHLVRAVGAWSHSTVPAR
jgi:hypothetical protein